MANIQIADTPFSSKVQIRAEESFQMRYYVFLYLKGSKVADIPIFKSVKTPLKVPTTSMIFRYKDLKYLI